MPDLTPTERAILAYVEANPGASAWNVALGLEKKEGYVRNVLWGLERRGLVSAEHGSGHFRWWRVGKGQSNA